jgi:hypothetical protein
VTVIVKDDKGETPTPLPTRTVIVLSSSSRPILSVKFKDHTNQDPNGKTYNIDMTAPLYTAQATISADILAYDITEYDIIAVIRRDYADGTTRILVGPIALYRVGIYSLENYIIHASLQISPYDILFSPMMVPYPDGITVDYTVKIYAVRSEVAGVWWWSFCEYDGSDNDLPDCESIINTIENHPSSVYSERKFKVRPSP